jgi:hypothetical protein
MSGGGGAVCGGAAEVSPRPPTGGLPEEDGEATGGVKADPNQRWWRRDAWCQMAGVTRAVLSISLLVHLLAKDRRKCSIVSR